MPFDSPIIKDQYAGINGECFHAAAAFSHGLDIIRNMRSWHMSAASAMALLAAGAETMLKLTIGLSELEAEGRWPTTHHMATELGREIVVLDREGRTLLSDGPRVPPVPHMLWVAGVVDPVLALRPDIDSMLDGDDTFEAGTAALNNAIVDALRRWWESYDHAWQTECIGIVAKVTSCQLRLHDPAGSGALDYLT